MSFFLAVDAGGTKTDYVLADAARDLARVRTGTIKRMRTDADTAARNFDSALTQLTAAGGVSMESITRTCVGTAGVHVPLVYDWLVASFKAKVSGGLLIVGDVEIALDAAFPGQPGVLVLAGTGSNVVGRYHAGELITAGGWGPALSDQGSGHRIGQKCLRAIFMAIDEQRSTILLEAVKEYWHLPSVESLVEYANSVPAPDFSRLTGLVLRCAEQGDQTARAVLQEQGGRTRLPGAADYSPAAHRSQRRHLDTADRLCGQYSRECSAGARRADHGGAARVPGRCRPSRSG